MFFFFFDLLSLHPQTDYAQDEKTSHPDGNHAESHGHFRVRDWPSFRNYVPHRQRRYREWETKGEIFQTGRHRLQGPEDSTQDDHWIEAAGGHETGSNVRVTEDRNQKAVQHSCESEEDEQTGHSQCVSLIRSVEEVRGIGHYL